MGKKLKPKSKYGSPSWLRRDKAREVLQRQHRQRVEREQAERAAADALLGAEADTGSQG